MVIHEKSTHTAHFYCKTKTWYKYTDQNNITVHLSEIGKNKNQMNPYYVWVWWMCMCICLYIICDDRQIIININKLVSFSFQCCCCFVFGRRCLNLCVAACSSFVCLFCFGYKNMCWFLLWFCVDACVRARIALFSFFGLQKSFFFHHMNLRGSEMVSHIHTYPPIWVYVRVWT